MRVGADHHPTRKSIVLQNHLVDDPRTRLPETDAVFIADRRKKIKHLAVRIQCHFEVFFCTCLSLDEMITMHGTGHGHLVPARLHELQQRHLCRSILHRYPVGMKVYIIFSPIIGPRTILI